MIMMIHINQRSDTRPQKYIQQIAVLKNTARRALKRKSFEMEKKQRHAVKKMIDNQKLKELKLMEEQIKLERIQITRYKARKMPKYKHTKIVLPRRRLKVPKHIGIYERGIKLQREKEQYLNEFRKLKDLQMGITPSHKLQRRVTNVAEVMDINMTSNGSESRLNLKVTQSLKLRQPS
eukprot:916914_1